MNMVGEEGDGYLSKALSSLPASLIVSSPSDHPIIVLNAAARGADQQAGNSRPGGRCKQGAGEKEGSRTLHLQITTVRR